MYQPKIDYDYELEAAVLGVFLLEPRSYSACIGLVIPECFYRPEHLQVFEAIAELYDAGHPIDLLTVHRHFCNRGVTQIGDGNTAYFLTMLTFNVVTSAHLPSWCIFLRELAIKRATIELTSGGSRQTDPLDAAAAYERNLKRLLEIKATDDWQDGGKVAIALTQHMEQMAGKPLPGLTTSISTFDRMNGGVRPGQMILIGARPSVGKSAFMGRVATAIAKTGTAVGIISLEMENKDIFSRIVSAESGIAHWQIDKSEFQAAEEHRHVLDNISRVAKLPIYFSDTAKVTGKDIRAKAEKLMRRHSLGALFIDYLQLVEPDSRKGKSREQEVAEISRETKVMAKTLGIPVFMLVQLNRQAAGEEPQLHHLRESGSLEQDADIVWMLHRDTESEDPAVKERATLFNRKWRNGSTSKVDLGFDGERMRFYEFGEIAPGHDGPIRSDNPRAGIGAASQPQSETDLPF